MGVVVVCGAIDVGGGWVTGRNPALRGWGGREGA